MNESFIFHHFSFKYFVLIPFQVMVPFNYTCYIDDMTSLVNKRVINMSRIDDAVRRILRVKFTMGLFENPLADLSFADYLGKKVDMLQHIAYYLYDRFENPSRSTK